MTIAQRMESLDLGLLKKLCETPGPPGREERVRKLVMEVLRPVCPEISIDTLGNVIAIKRGKGKR